MTPEAGTPGGPEVRPEDLAVWFVAVEAPGRRAEWDWNSLGAPDPRGLLPVRRPSSGDLSRHIPVTAYSVKTGTHHELESMLEHELLRVLERRRDVAWFLAQPVVIHMPGRRGASHTPDLLSVHADGCVTLWDVRPRERVDELFGRKAEFTRAAATAVGWRYEVFHGAPTRVERLNARWLHEARRPRTWHDAKRAELESLIAEGGVTIGDILDRGDPALTSTMWHLAWTGEIHCDLTQPIRGASRLAWSATTTLSEAGSTSPQPREH